MPQHTSRDGQLPLGTFSQHAGTDYAQADRWGQQSLPGLSQPSQPAAHVPATSGPGVVPQRPPGAPETSEPQQLKMFMSQREIMHQYQPLDADLHENDDYRAGEWTYRPKDTQGFPNSAISTRDRGQPFMRDAPASADYRRSFTGRPETHDEMMNRKLEESKMDYHEYAEVHGGGVGTQKTPGYDTAANMTGAPQYEGSGHTDTYDYNLGEFHNRQVEKHYDKMSGSLFGDLHHAMRPGGEGFTGIVHLATGQFGMAGKPQIGGAHHRLAAMGEIDPDRLMPVIHHNKMTDARWGDSAKVYPYT